MSQWPPNMATYLLTKYHSQNTSFAIGGDSQLLYSFSIFKMRSFIISQSLQKYCAKRSVTTVLSITTHLNTASTYHKQFWHKDTENIKIQCGWEIQDFVTSMGKQHALQGNL